MLLFTACREGDAKDSVSEKPYKATTVDECTQERECVWHHFLLGIQNHANPKKISNDVALRKWVSPIRIRIIGKKEQLSAKMYQDYINQIFPYIPHEISIETKYNFLIVETNDIEKEINGEFRQIALAALAPTESLRNSGIIKIKDNTKCHNFYLVKNENGIEGYLSFIKQDDEVMESCLKEMVYEGFGLSAIHASPIFKGKKFSSQYSDLELFILYLFYNDSIRAGADLSEVKKNFNKLYKPALNYFNKKKDLIK